MMGLDPPAARSAAANVDLVADTQRAGLGEMLNLLDRHPFGDQLAAAAKTAPFKPDRHDQVDALGWLPVRVPAEGAGLAPGSGQVSTAQAARVTVAIAAQASGRRRAARAGCPGAGPVTGGAVACWVRREGPCAGGRAEALGV